MMADLDGYLRRRLAARLASGRALSDAPAWVIGLATDPTYRARHDAAFRRRHGRPMPTLREVNVAARVAVRVSHSRGEQPERQWYLDAAARDGSGRPMIGGVQLTPCRTTTEESIEALDSAGNAPDTGARTQARRLGRA